MNCNKSASVVLNREPSFVSVYIVSLLIVEIVRESSAIRDSSLGSRNTASSWFHQKSHSLDPFNQMLD